VNGYEEDRLTLEAIKVLSLKTLGDHAFPKEKPDDYCSHKLKGFLTSNNRNLT
jgi:hypothetical protein